MFGSFLPSLGCLAAIKSTQVEGADIVMKSNGVPECPISLRISPVTRQLIEAHVIFRAAFPNAFECYGGSFSIDRGSTNCRLGFNLLSWAPVAVVVLF